LSDELQPASAKTARDTAPLADTVAARAPDQARLHATVKSALFGGPPPRFGRFEVVEEIGRGAMGSVFAARDPELDRLVAVKVLAPDWTSSDAPARLRREAKALARLSHPNVVPVYEVGVADGQLFVAMEHVVGQTLREWVAEKSPDWRACLDAYAQAARGLAAAHAASLVHRDFKPDNAMIGDDGRVRVVDFGLAAAGDEGTAAPGATRKEDGGELGSLTRTGALVGTPAYMAPELLDGASGGGSGGAAADQYAWCVSLYEAIAGRRPVAAKTLEELRARLSDGEPKLGLPRDTPSWLVAVLQRGLRTDPRRRFPSLDDLIAEIDRHARPRRRGVWIAGGVTIAALGAAVWLRSGADDPNAACEAAVARAAEVWSPARREQYAALELPPHSDEAWRSTHLTFFDAHVEEWTDKYREACPAPPGGDTAGEVLACLDQDLAALDGFVAESLAQGTAVAARGIVPVLAHCDPPYAARRPTAVEGGRWQEVAALHRSLAIEGPSDELRASAEALDYAPVIARVVVAEAAAALGRDEFARVDTLLQEATDLANAGHDDISAAEIGVLRALRLGETGQRDAQAQALPRAAAALERIAYDPVRFGYGVLRLAYGMDPADHTGRLAMLDRASPALAMLDADSDYGELRMTIAMLRSQELVALERPEDAAAELARLETRLAAEIEHAPPAERVNGLTKLGVLAYSRGDRDTADRAWEEGLQVATAIDDRGSQVALLGNLTESALKAHDDAAALAPSQRLVDLLRTMPATEPTPTTLAMALQQSAFILARLGRLADATTALRDALAAPDGDVAAWRVQSAALAFATDEPDLARSRAEAILDRLRREQSPRLSDALAVVAAADIATGDPSAAIRRLDDPQVLIADPHGHARRVLAWALLAADRDPIRAGELRDAAAAAEADDDPFAGAFDAAVTRRATAGR
jgi:tetratricopeptide (TPR) repeat protein/predicted Ser/Thr protein kinase